MRLRWAPLTLLDQVGIVILLFCDHHRLTSNTALLWIKRFYHYYYRQVVMEWSTPCLDSWVGLFDQALSWWNERSDRVMNTIMFCTWEYSWTFRMWQNACTIQLLVHFWRYHYHDTSKNAPITLNNNNNKYNDHNDWNINGNRYWFIYKTNW